MGENLLTLRSPDNAGCVCIQEWEEPATSPWRFPGASRVQVGDKNKAPSAFRASCGSAGGLVHSALASAVRGTPCALPGVVAPSTSAMHYSFCFGKTKRQCV